jgi:hypothetical protein
MNWFISSDKEVMVNLDHFHKISEFDGVVKLHNFSHYNCDIELTQEQHEELINFIDPSKKDQNNFGEEYYVKSELPKSTPEPTPATPIKDDFVFKDIIEYNEVNKRWENQEKEEEQKQLVREHAVLNEILEINEHIKCDNCKKNIYI